MAQTGIDLHLFNMMSEEKDKEFTLDELAEKTEADPILLCKPLRLPMLRGGQTNVRFIAHLYIMLADRILRFLASYGMVTQTPTNTFQASNITHNLALPGTHAGIKH